MKLDLCHLVALEYRTPFKNNFITMYQVLNLNCNIIENVNHKELMVEHFNRVLKKGSYAYFYSY